MERVASTVHSLWAMLISQIWIMQMTLPSLLTPWMDDLSRGLRDNSVTTWLTCVLAENENSEPGCRLTNIHLSVCGGCSWVYIFCSTDHRQCQSDILRQIGIAFTAMQSMNSMATVSASTADETPLIPELYNIHPIVRFGSMDTSADLPHVLPAYDPRDTLAWLHQKYRSRQHYQPALYQGHHHQEAKLTVWPCVKTQRQHANPSCVVQVAAIRTGSCTPGWCRRIGCPCNSWIQQIANGTPFGILAEWSRARCRGRNNWRNGPLPSMWSDDDGVCMCYQLPRPVITAYEVGAIMPSSYLLQLLPGLI